jgi:aminoglycoside phosphotransferase
MALPLDSSFSVLRAGCVAFPAFTLKRKIFRIAALILAGVLWGARRVGLPAGAHLDSADAAVLARIKEACPQMAAAMLIWSLVPGRQRIYVRVFDANANECAFAKVSRVEPGRSWLQVEATALHRYSEARSFSCPRVLMLDVTETDVLLLTSALPPGSTLRHAETSIFPRTIQSEIQNQVVQASFSSLHRRAWYKRGIAALAANARVTSELAAIDDASPVALAPAHGDFGSENFYVDPARRVYLIDWEHFCDAAPILTDEVGFWIGKNHRAIRRGAREVARDFAQEFEEHCDSDLLLALIFLSAFDITDASRLVALWKS